MKTTRGDRGSATILMIMIASVIIIVGLGFNWLVREHIRAAEGLKNKAEAILNARSAFDMLIYLLLSGHLSWKEIIITGATDITELKSLPVTGQAIQLSEGLRVRIQDSNGMLSLTSLHTVPIERLIKNTENVNYATAPVNSLLDWSDADGLKRIDGAEAFDYSAQGLPYAPRNFPLQYKDEAGFIKGFDKGLYGRIKDDLTMLPSFGFNPNTASDAALMAVLDINRESLQTLKEFMSQMPIISNNQLFALTGRKLTGEDNFFSSPFMEVIVEAGAPKVIYSIRAGLNVVQNEYAPYGVVFWSEE